MILSEMRQANFQLLQIFVPILKLNMADSQRENLTVKRLAKSSPCASLRELFNACGELRLRSRKRLSLNKESNPLRNPQHYFEEGMKRLMHVPVEETQTITNESKLLNYAFKFYLCSFT